MKRVLVTGGGGQVGHALGRLKWPEGWSAVTFPRYDLDIEDHNAIATTIAAQSWAAVINAAAYTAVDHAEAEPSKAWTINALGPAVLAEHCRAADIPLVQISTDYVFSGAKSGSWLPEDTTDPISVYGGSKLGGELAVRTAGGRHAIVRTSWVVGSHGNNFVRTMLRLAADRDCVKVVSDQTGSPTIADDLAAALAQIAISLSADAAASGTYHFTNAGATNWADFAREVFIQSERRGGPSARVESIPTIAYPTPAKRPMNSLLDTHATLQAFGIVPRRWQAALSDVMDSLIKSPAATVGPL
jgi:dTDP-4-dehydrorhamnose reductase